VSGADVKREESKAFFQPSAQDTCLKRFIDTAVKQQGSRKRGIRNHERPPSASPTRLLKFLKLSFLSYFLAFNLAFQGKVCDNIWVNEKNIEITPW
jgi:hypothetical protein